ncbi:MAG TPA: uracil phosphoribosyltransferase [Bacteroidales bacterium]|jgi:uracil phosphoribosyltransferase|nr:uracil phosphoribosyltransferase [Bacteroidales bacterium]MDD4086893.1 uracil phosphoribosyltransferase [Bacteroidales bacterium]MDY0084890.1 uracil phosphoribosyltransferase [Bacteroidales bacterium]HPE43247.1 uracil phosphoribosyltransferase [Bacteroidales bacterium]
MATIINIGESNSIFNHFIAELRSTEIQQDRMRFRRNLERIGEIFAYEISKKLDYQPHDVTTPLGVATVNQLIEQPLLATILRAGLPLHQGLLNYFDRADSAFITAYRKYDKNEDFTIRVEYVSSPSIGGKILVLSDPMLATGASIVKTMKSLLASGMPKSLHIVSVLASSEGLDYIKRNLSLHNLTVWVGGIDDELTAQAYIVPGLGDAGDLAFGEKD